MDDRSQRSWEHDHVVTNGGVAIPVRATAQRPGWADLPRGLRDLVETLEGSSVVSTWSAGTGFTPGFASRLDLADGSRVFVKAASSLDDEISGWPLSDAYREEVRKLSALPAGVGAPGLRWHRDLEIDGLRWIVLGLEHVDGVPPRRPWRLHELRLVLGKLAEVAVPLTQVPVSLGLEPIDDHLMAGMADRLATARERGGEGDWLDTVERLTAPAHEILSGGSIVHLDLRDDNVLIDSSGGVWFVDWNWPALGAAWIDLVCLLISAAGDGLDADTLLRQHPLMGGVPPEAVDCLLAVLWSFWAVARWAEVPVRSPHLRNHQIWYADATKAWLEARLRSHA